jgi:hypothetical protein
MELPPPNWTVRTEAGKYYVRALTEHLIEKAQRGLNYEALDERESYLCTGDNGPTPTQVV